MLTQYNLKNTLLALGFIESGSIYEKVFPQFSCSLKVDFSKQKLIYPESIKGRERNDGFDKKENFVVFECVNRLLEKGYRPEHLELEKQWQLGHEQKGGRADICIYDIDASMLCIIECKTFGKEFDKYYKKTLTDGDQLFSYWQQERATKWLVIYASDLIDGQIVYKAPSINCTDYKSILESAKKDKAVLSYVNAYTKEQLYEVWKETYSCKIYDDLVFSLDSRAYQIGIKPLRKKDLREFNPDDKIVNKFDEILRHNNVSDKENAFNRLVALFICKLVDEITKNDNDEVEFQYKLGTDTYETLMDRLQRLHTEGMLKFMREKIVYIPADYPEQLFLTYTGQQRQKAIDDLKEKIRILKYYSNNDFSFKDVHNEELFFQNGKVLVEVVQLFEKYRIVYPSKHQFLGDLFENLLKEGFKQNEGQYFTPIPITRFIWDSLPINKLIHNEEGTVLPKVIDYACGAGHFLTEAVEAINYFLRLEQEDHVDKEDKQSNEWVRDHIFGIEKDYRLARVSKISLFMNGAGEGNIIFGDGLENAPDKHIENNSFDVLVANPPYSVAGFKQHLRIKNNRFELLNRIGDNGSEIEVLFVERIAQLLKPNGVAAVILPSTILSNDISSYIGAREHLLQNFYIRAIVQFGGKTFSATDSSTVALFLEKYYEPPKKKDMISDCVSAIMSDREIEDWEDKSIIASYLQKIGVSKGEYSPFIFEKKRLQDLIQLDYFKTYIDAFSTSSELNKLKKSKLFQQKSDEDKEQEIQQCFYSFAKAIEKEKLFYYAMTYTQKTVIITAPTDDKKQKDFLGYKWSDAKGREGIKILTPGGKLYSDRDRMAPNTLASAIRNAFGECETTIDEDVKEYEEIVATCDLLDFSRPKMNKALRTSIKKKTCFISDYTLESIGSILTLEYGKSLPESSRVEGDFPVLGSSGRVGTHNTFLVQGPSIIVGRKGSAGALHWEPLNCYPIDTTYYVQMKSNEYLLRYIYYILQLIDYEGLIDKMGVPGLNRENVYGIRIPKPSIPVQKEVIEECIIVENEYRTTRMPFEQYRQKIEFIFSKLNVAKCGMQKELVET